MGEIIRGGHPIKTLIVGLNPWDYFVPWVTDKNITIGNPTQLFWFGRRNVLLRILYRLGWITRVQVHDLFFRRALRGYDKIILMNYIPAQFLDNPLLRRPHRAVTYVYFWDIAAKDDADPAEVQRWVETLHGQHAGLYSFQRKDCETYGLRFNDTFYYPPPAFDLPDEAHCHTPLQYDLCFLGLSKDRLPILREVYDTCRSLDLRVKFYVRRYFYGLYPVDGIEPEEKDGWTIADEIIPYPEYLGWLRESRAVLDIYQQAQTGFSLRPMEHIFFGKKLVTNNRVIRQADFYHPDNIFVLGQDDIKNLKAWLDLPYVPVAQEIKEYYSIERWLERFE